jgi:hypothetical protein
LNIRKKLLIRKARFHGGHDGWFENTDVDALYTAAMQESFGSVSVFPTLFFVDKKGMIVKHLVNFHEKATLEAAIKLALE